MAKLFKKIGAGRSSKNSRRGNNTSSTSVTAETTTRSSEGAGRRNNNEVAGRGTARENNSTAGQAPPRKRKSADKQSIIITSPPWKSPGVGDQFPNFSGNFTRQVISDLEADLAETFVGEDNLDYYAIQGTEKWGLVLVFPSYDVSTVSISELLVLSYLREEFESRNVQLCGFTINPCSTNRLWMKQVCEKTDQMNAAYFPMFCDTLAFDNAVELGVLDEEQTAECGVPILSRSTILISPDKTITLTTSQQPTVGRDFQCILRQIDQAQDAAKSIDGILLAKRVGKVHITEL
eukprot:CAMPEP_0116055788 /NCGR_PEP_ID=MMETSP0322-20121206/3615_1 /TAXON_ID=163516 /ORGANISM="Leptocylindrus danicus var. apora, Strain B651" /LENGTH=291 /DNA_ID=CAMNT_0003539457 /DNA_START=2237 /DNA_END=3112 /DNA_ORIENTATION=-